MIVADSYITDSAIALWARHAKGGGSHQHQLGAFVNLSFRRQICVCADLCLEDCVSEYHERKEEAH